MFDVDLRPDLNLAVHNWEEIVPNSKKFDDTPLRLCFLLFDGFSNHCLGNAVEPLRAANTLSGRELYRWQFVSVTGQGVTSSSGLPVMPHECLRLAEGDMLVVMPSYGYLGWCTGTTLRALRSTAFRFATIAGFDTGSWLMAEAGLLDGYHATIHWDEFQAFQDQFPTVDAIRSRFVFDRDRITCAGATAAFDLTLELILRVHGPALAMEVAQIFMTQLADVANLYQGVPRGRLIRRVIAKMRDNVEHPLPITKLAKDLGCSHRKLANLVRQELGLTSQALYRRIRLSHVRKLLDETDLPIGEIAIRAGYENASALSRAFRMEFGVTPSGLRARSYYAAG